MISVGSSLPEAPSSLWEGSANASVKFPATGKIIIVGLPGAFTPPCSSHVPGYIAHFDEFVAKGVSGIYLLAVNDIFVVNAWKESLGPKSQVHFLSDSTAAYVKLLGMELDATGLLGNIRSQRFVAVVQDGKVVDLRVEPDAPGVTVTAAEKVLASL
ncbi:hypothetical protein Q9L58_009785 [Maublancomyces gigas]|uniref:Thioredoxin domain-containing protein n=1 Tax=Discina gigas TaxID=1032678 RepID=A0ABR3G600_9PEZI